MFSWHIIYQKNFTLLFLGYWLKLQWIKIIDLRPRVLVQVFNDIEELGIPIKKEKIEIETRITTRRGIIYSHKYLLLTHQLIFVFLLNGTISCFIYIFLI